ncbi:hypothetical protein BOTBODRAFT_210353 [Botryobasidium botryosum FD-172 SS1]|uniref:Zn-dependent PLC domain-containing protein n=1 Tax=Botryobasidium botryosum (strain FD-172 SS1) TaxID=930990 RepID=A0A067N0Z1_BOTB1|nr:hypothetical protein BOTBODRAFT_210353 [Botryobasidium botryosum FD-172 SS1]
MESLRRPRSRSILRRKMEGARTLPNDLSESLLETTNRYYWPALVDAEPQSRHRSQSIFASMRSYLRRLAASIESPNILVDLREAYIASPDSETFFDAPIRSRPRLIHPNPWSWIGDQLCTSPRGTIHETDANCRGFVGGASSARARGESSSQHIHAFTIWCCCHAATAHNLVFPGHLLIQTRSLDLILNPWVPFRSSAHETLEVLLGTTAMSLYVENILKTLPCPHYDLTWSHMKLSPFSGWVPSIGDIQEASLRCKLGSRRRALIVAVEYKGQEWNPNGITVGKNGRTRVLRDYGSGDELKMDLSTHDDARKIKALVQHHGYEDSEIRMLLDDEGDPSLQPTKHNIEEGMRWLVDEAYPGDNLFFYFAGHGEQVIDEDGDEDDGMDESILPVDHQCDVDQDIVDDEIFEAMVKPLPLGCKLTALIDCCHSGTLLDLRYPYRLNSSGSIADVLAQESASILRKRTRGRGRRGRQSTTGCTYTADPANLKITEHRIDSDTSFPQRHTFGDAVSISACTDSQLAYGTRKGGWMTGQFLRILEHNPHQTYRELLKCLTAKLNRITELARQQGKADFLPQTVQLYSAHPLDLDSPFSF